MPNCSMTHRRALVFGDCEGDDFRYPAFVKPKLIATANRYHDFLISHST